MDKYLNANIVFSRFSRDYMDIKSGLPIRPSELAVLSIITRRDGKFTPLMIKELLGVSKPMITAHINILERKGYIFKEYLISDKRSFYVMPTEKAKELVDKAEKTMTEQLIEMEQELGEKQFAELVNLLEKAQSSLKKE